MPSKKIGEGHIEVRLDDSKIKGDSEKAGNKAKGFLGKAGGFAAGAFKIGLAGIGTAAVGAVAGISSLINKQVELNDELKTAANRIGIPVEKLQSLRNVAEKLGSEDGLEGVVDSAQELSLRLNDATKDGFRADEALTQLGLSGARLRNMTPTGALMEVIKALQGMENQQKKNWLSDELMGGSWEHIAGMLNVSNEEMTAMIANEAKHEETLKKSLEQTQKFQEQTGKLKATWNGWTNSLLVAVLPAINKTFDFINDPVIPILERLFRGTSEGINPAFEKWGKIWTDTLQPAIKTVTEIFKRDFLPHLKEIGEVVMPIVIAAAEILWKSLQHGVNFIKGPFAQAFGRQIVNVLGVLKGILMIIAGVLTGDFSKAWRGVALVAESVINMMLNGLETIANASVSSIGNMFNRAADLLGKVPGMKKKAEALRSKAPDLLELPRVKFSDDSIRGSGGYTPPKPSFGFEDIPGFASAYQKVKVTNVDMSGSLILDETGWTDKVSEANHLADRMDTEGGFE